ncbi:MAG: phospholipid carrier-dependent glycosyltransferase, partial [Clostridia bacterium]|nr:phospholipid carrier-dependent glycosyltransferase [Clostridia bacterium]
LGLTAIIMAWHKGEKQVHRQMLRGIIYAITVFLLCYLPFSLSLEREQPGWLIQKYLDTLSSYAYATVNTANLYYLFGFNWNPITNPASLAPAAILGMIALGYGLSSSGLLISRGRKYPFLEGILNIIFAVFFLLCGFVSLSWSFLGYAALAFCVVNVVLMYIRSGDLKQLPLLGAILFLLLYTLSIKMHERYLFPAIMLFALAYLIQRDFRIFILLCVTTVTMFVNEGIVLDNAVRLGASLGHLNQDTVILADILAVINLLMIPLALWVVCDLCLCGNPEKEAPTLHLLHSRQVSSDAHSASRFHTDPSLHWKKLDSVLIITITVCYGILGLSHLGSHKAPENPWTSTGLDESVVLDLGEKHENFSMLYFCQVSYSNFAVSVSDDGVLWSDEMAAEMDQGQCFRWKYLMPSTGGIQNPSFAGGNTYHSVEKLTGRYVRIRANQIGLRLCEVIFRETLDVEKSDGSFTQVSGERIPYTIAYRDGANADSPLFSVPQALCDEQDSLEGEPGWYNGTYFDEIYHARTAYEHLTGTSPYETTHPPLGKVMMSWAVGIFGMNPFGWRFAGALAGILMIPAIYLLTKQMTKRTCMAALSAVILSLDAMHYTQTRIATIDSFPVLFILFAYFFMLRFMQHDLGTSPLKSLLPSLALSGFFMGCAVASKWIGVYAGAGLAVLFFWTLARHLRLAKDAKHQITLCAPDDIISKEMKTRAETTMKTCILLCLWCLLFFVAVPLTIYLLSYIPYFAYQHPQTLGDFLKLVWKAQESMLSYHSQPGLGMDHPFYSPWYEWPLISRPMYYAMAYYVPAGKSYSIFCFGNPAIWWTGIAGMAAVLLCLVYRHFYAAASSHGEFHLYSSSWSQVPAFLLISFLAQFLPWVLVPRGTYIYHYFASVPFLILANTLALYWLMKKFPRIGKIATAIYLLCAIVLFILLFPYASGITAPYAWLDIGKEILHVYYALPTG